MTKTIANQIDVIVKHEAAIENNFHLNYDKVYLPLFKLLSARHEYFETLKGRTDIKVNAEKLAYDIKQGIRDDKGEYLVWTKSEISQYSKFALMTKKEFLAVIDKTGGNTLKSASKNMYASIRAEQSKKSKANKNETPAQKGAKTREQNKLNEAMQELTDGFLVCQKAFEISQSDNYGAMSMPEIEQAMKSILSAMLKDNDISSAKADKYSELKKTG